MSFTTRSRGSDKLSPATCPCAMCHVRPERRRVTSEAIQGVQDNQQRAPANIGRADGHARLRQEICTVSKSDEEVKRVVEECLCSRVSAGACETATLPAWFHSFIYSAGGEKGKKEEEHSLEIRTTQSYRLCSVFPICSCQL